MAVQSYEQLDAWQKAMDLVTEVYRATMVFPADEKFGLTSQLRRASVSIPSNIAEGQGRRTTGEFLHGFPSRVVHSWKYVRKSRSPEGWPICGRPKSWSTMAIRSAGCSIA